MLHLIQLCVIENAVQGDCWQSPRPSEGSAKNITSDSNNVQPLAVLRYTVILSVQDTAVDVVSDVPAISQCLHDVIPHLPTTHCQQARDILKHIDLRVALVNVASAAKKHVRTRVCFSPPRASGGVRLAWPASHVHINLQGICIVPCQKILVEDLRAVPGGFGLKVALLIDIGSKGMCESNPQRCQSPEGCFQARAIGAHYEHRRADAGMAWVFQDANSS